MQFIVTKINKIVQEIYDMKRRRATTYCKNTPKQEDTYGKGEEGYKNSSYSNPQP